MDRVTDAGITGPGVSSHENSWDRHCLSDAGLSDSGLSDAGLADAGVWDAGLSHVGLADAGVSSSRARSISIA